ncbi:hypothetical protein PQI07_06535 [Methylobacterium sp. 092160098-2]|uniref:hypothetical protein n=1 Tax=Methylobacterium sp. 092160098-2 TaxID=3025129 RepID=UPI00238194B4|nr:hypothetical protein [Methylobacterium sp. 092160098-2]MDE4910358.1 hypothetical protein [Methylobacterium sp. 092160098-2]
MALTSEHAVQPYVRTKKGRVGADHMRKCSSADAARALAERLVADGIAIGAVALTRTCDPVLGEYEDPEILVRVGAVPGNETDLPF